MFPLKARQVQLVQALMPGSSGMVVYEICVLIRLCGGLQNKKESYTEPC